jgi:thioredoxin-related protein
MKKTIIGFIFIILLSFSISAQTKEARKFDEFESYTCEEMMMRLDIFGNELSNEPTSKGFVIVFEGNYSKYVYKDKDKAKLKTFLPRFGESILRTYEMQIYFLNFRKFPKERVSFIDGGFRKNHTVELWIIPSGTTLPKSLPSIENIQYRKGKPQNNCSEIG